MTTLQKEVVIVLGATGLVGRTVSRYLKENVDGQVFGTARKLQTDLFFLDVETFSQDIQKIQKQVGKISWVINCIGQLREPNISEEKFITINSNFPHQLEIFFSTTATKIIHISSDAVFNNLSGKVKENDRPTPEDIYGVSKLNGEITGKNSLTIRSSFLGMDPENKKGILEWLAHCSESEIPGFKNQKWSGCTTLQFAQFCLFLLKNNNAFQKLRSCSAILHFSPLFSTKYEIIKTAIELQQLSITVQSIESFKITRNLASNFSKELSIEKFGNSIEVALKDMYKYEK